ncbi:MAG: heat-inducible transcriptional repressor HrcA [Deltaproteobacteria bacterium]|nr:heat-inducible transcriptional repressor HrcA [Deltaproteobacteria bacterium]
MSLTEREGKILEIIIDTYVDTAQPVGSKAVSRALNYKLSSATVRHIMYDLEEQGYLYKPHAVSGRIPTTKAFRYYIDTLLNLRVPGKKDLQVISSFIKPSYSYVEEAMMDASRALAAISRYAGIVVEPKLNTMQFKGVEFVRLTNTSLLVLFVATSGMVYKRIITLEENIPKSLLEGMKHYMNERLEGLTFFELRSRLLEDIQKDREEFRLIISKIRESLDSLITGPEKREIYIEGTSKIIGIPEFTDIIKIREIFKALEQKEKLLSILDKSLAQNDVVVIVGEECQIKEMKEMSIIASPFAMNETSTGVLGVIGPLRMDYSKLIPVVNYTARMLSEHLTNM